MNTQPNNPLHGIKLEEIVIKLANHYSWEQLGHLVQINCFRSNPSVKSSLNFLRKNQWARDQVENLYLSTFYNNTTTKNPAKPIDPWDTLLKNKTRKSIDNKL